MALFDSFKKKPAEKGQKSSAKSIKSTKTPKETSEVVSVPKVEVKAKTAHRQGRGMDASHIVLRPRITEKASMLADHGAYVFDVHREGTKGTIAQAIKAQYGVTPKKVHIINTPGKRIVSRTTGRTNTSVRGRKAVVYLKKGDKIEFV